MSKFFNDMNPVVSFKRKENEDLAKAKVEIAALAERLERLTFQITYNRTEINQQVHDALSAAETQLNKIKQLAWWAVSISIIATGVAVYAVLG